MVATISEMCRQGGRVKKIRSGPWHKAASHIDYLHRKYESPKFVAGGSNVAHGLLCRIMQRRTPFLEGLPKVRCVILLHTGSSDGCQGAT